MPPADPPLRWRVLSLPKRGHAADENEDAWAADPARGRFAVADGATESAFAGLWARLLAHGFVAAARPRGLSGWLGAARRRWSDEVMGLDLPWYAEMKRDEGSFATVAGLRLRPPAPGRPGRWRAVAVGDSCLIRLRKDRRARAFPVRRSCDFGNQPRLIGSHPGPAPARRCAGSLRPGDRLFLMTDALAQWFLGRYEGGGRPWESLAPLLAAAEPQAAFADWVEGQRTQGGMRNDDVTLLSIDFAPDQPAPGLYGGGVENPPESGTDGAEIRPTDEAPPEDERGPAAEE